MPGNPKAFHRLKQHFQPPEFVITGQSVVYKDGCVLHCSDISKTARKRPWLTDCSGQIPDQPAANVQSSEPTGLHLQVKPEQAQPLQQPECCVHADAFLPNLARTLLTLY